MSPGGDLEAVTGLLSRLSAAYTGFREVLVADLSIRCQNCGKTFQAKQERRRYCGDPCRWAAWKRGREEKARAPLERILVGLPARLEELASEIREALGDKN